MKSEICGAVVNVGSITMPAGEYWVGDPCYAIRDDDWMEWLKNANYEDERRFLLADLAGHPAIGVGTAFGDGSYLDEGGREYPVDAGLIGAVPWAISIPSPSGMHRFTFHRPFDVSYEEDHGTIIIGHIRIETDPPAHQGWEY